jgi:hypothetical protein
MYASIKDAVAALGHVQEPELTVLKGVGPFPVALFRGASAAGDFAPEGSVPEGTAAREVAPARSARLLESYVAHVKASGKGAIAVGGNVTNSTLVTGSYRRGTVDDDQDR